MFCITGKFRKTCVANTEFFLQSIAENFDIATETNVVVRNTGDILYVSPRIFKSNCEANVTPILFVSVSFSKKPSIHILFIFYWVMHIPVI